MPRWNRILPRAARSFFKESRSEVGVAESKLHGIGNVTTQETRPENLGACFVAIDKNFEPLADGRSKQHSMRHANLCSHPACFTRFLQVTESAVNAVEGIATAAIDVGVSHEVVAGAINADAWGGIWGA